jgi:hypothetical protein
MILDWVAKFAIANRYFLCLIISRDDGQTQNPKKLGRNKVAASTVLDDKVLTVT